MIKVRTAAAIANVGLPTYYFSSEVAPLGVTFPGCKNVLKTIKAILKEGYTGFCLRTEWPDNAHLEQCKGFQWPLYPVNLNSRLKFYIFRNIQPGSTDTTYAIDYLEAILDGGVSKYGRMDPSLDLSNTVDFNEIVQPFGAFPFIYEHVSCYQMRIAIQDSSKISHWNATVAWDRINGRMDGRYGLVGEVNPTSDISHREALSSGGLKATGVLPVSQWFSEDRGKLRYIMRDHAIPGIWYECSKIDGSRFQFWDIAEDSTRAYSSWCLNHLKDIDLIEYHLDYRK